MPFGVWKEDDWKSLDPGGFTVPGAVSTALSVPAGSSTRKLGPLQRKPPSSQGLGCADPVSLQDVEARSAPLLRALSDVRRVKTAPGASSSRVLPSARTSSGRVGAKSSPHGSQDMLEQDRPSQFLRRSAHTVRTWSDLGKDGSKSMFTYPVPLSQASTSLQSFASIGTSQITESIDDLLSDSPPVFATRQPVKTKASEDLSKREAIKWEQAKRSSMKRRSSGDEPVTSEDDHKAEHWIEQDWTKVMTLEEVIQELPNTNLTSHSAPDTLTKLICATAEAATTEPDQSVTNFTRRYFAACNMYGQMLDEVRKITKNVVNLDIELGGAIYTHDVEDLLKVGGLLRLSGRNLETLKHDEMYTEALRHERTMLVEGLKEILRRLDSFHWDTMAFDFRKWIQNADMSEVILRELLDQIADHSKEVLSLLALSRYLIEESIGMHLLSAARTLTEFHDQIIKQMQEVERQKGGRFKESRKLTNAPKMTLIKSRIEQLSDDRDRQMRNLEVNRNLYQHMITATAHPMADFAVTKSDGLSHARRSSSDKQMTKIVSETPMDVERKISNKVSQSKPSSQPSGSRLTELSGLEVRRHAHIENTFMRCIMAAKRFVEKIHTAHTERAGSIKKMKQALRRAFRKTLPDGDQGPVMAETDPDSMASLCYLNADEQVEVRWLLRRRRELWDDINHLTVSVSIRDMLTSEELTHQLPMPTVNFGDADVSVIEMEAKLKRGGGKRPTLKQTAQTVKVMQKAINASGFQGRQRRRAIIPATSGLLRQDDAGTKQQEEQEQMALMEELEMTLARLERKLQVKISKCRKKAHKANDLHGEETWVFNADMLMVWFLQNPQQWLMQAVHEATTELEENSMDDDLQEGLVDISRDVETLLSEFKKELKARKRALNERMPFNAKDWAGRIDGPLSMVMQMFSNWLRQARKRGFEFADVDCIHNEEEENNLLDSIPHELLKEKEDQMNALQAKYDSVHAEIEEMRQENSDIQNSKEGYKCLDVKLNAFDQLTEVTEGLQQNLDDLVQEIKTVMMERKNLHVTAIRGGYGLGGPIVVPKKSAKKSSIAGGEEDDLELGDDSLPSALTSLQDFESSLNMAGNFLKTGPRMKEPDGSDVSPEEEAKKAARKKKNFSNSSRKNQLIESGKATRFTMHSMPKLSDSDRQKLKGHIETAASQGRVLEMRAQRKRAELTRLCRKIQAQQSGGKVKAQEGMTTQEAQEKWERDMTNLRHQLRNAKKMHDFWKFRFDAWHSELIDKYGNEILDELEKLAEEHHRHHKKESIAGPSGESTERRGQSFIMADKRRSLYSGTAADSWEVTKDSRVSKAFLDAFSALNVMVEQNVKRGTVTNQHSDVMKWITIRNQSQKNRKSLKLGNYGDDMDDLFAESHKAMHASKELHFGGGFSYSNNKKGSLKRGLDFARTSLFIGGLDQVAGKAVSSPRGMKKAAPRMQVMDCFLDSPLSGGTWAVHGFHGQKLKAVHNNRVQKGLVSLKRGPAGRAAKMQELGLLGLEGHHLGDAPKGQKAKAKAKPKAKGRADADDDEEKGEQKYFSPYRQMRKADMKKDEKPSEFEVTSDRLQSLKNRKRRDTLLFRKGDGSVLKNNVSMLKMFMGDVSAGNDQEQEFGAYSMMPSREGSPDLEQKEHAAQQQRRRLTAALQAHGQQAELVDALEKVMDGNDRINADSDSSSSSESDLSDDSTDEETANAKRLIGRNSKITLQSSDAKEAQKGEQNVWQEFNDMQRAVTMLRACRDKLVQRFGGIDKAYVKCTPAVVGMTDEVWCEIVGMMGYEEKHARTMFRLISSLVPKSRKGGHKKDAARAFKMAERPPIARSDFSDAMRSIAPVRTFVQLRMRLRRKYPSLEAAWTVASNQGDEDHSPRSLSRNSSRGTLKDDVARILTGDSPVRPMSASAGERKARPLSATGERKPRPKSAHGDKDRPQLTKSVSMGEPAAEEKFSGQSVSAANFRDFLATVGVTASEARTLFNRMADHNDRECSKGETLEVSKHAFILTLAHADGIDAVANMKERLEKLLPPPPPVFDEPHGFSDAWQKRGPARSRSPPERSAARRASQESLQDAGLQGHHQAKSALKRSPPQQVQRSNSVSRSQDNSPTGFRKDSRQASPQDSSEGSRVQSRRDSQQPSSSPSGLSPRGSRRPSLGSPFGLSSPRASRQGSKERSEPPGSARASRQPSPSPSRQPSPSLGLGSPRSSRQPSRSEASDVANRIQESVAAELAKRSSKRGSQLESDDSVDKSGEKGDHSLDGDEWMFSMRRSRSHSIANVYANKFRESFLRRKSAAVISGGGDSDSSGGSKQAPFLSNAMRVNASRPPSPPDGASDSGLDISMSRSPRHSRARGSLPSSLPGLAEGSEGTAGNPPESRQRTLSNASSSDSGSDLSLSRASRQRASVPALADVPEGSDIGSSSNQNPRSARHRASLPVIADVAEGTGTSESSEPAASGSTTEAAAATDGGGNRGSLKRRGTVSFADGTNLGIDDDGTRKKILAKRGMGVVAEKFTQKLDQLRRKSVGVSRELIEEKGQEVTSRSRGSVQVGTRASVSFGITSLSGGAQRGSVVSENPFGISSYSAAAQRGSVSAASQRGSVVSQNPFGISSYSAPANAQNSNSDEATSRSGSKGTKEASHSPSPRNSSNERSNQESQSQDWRRSIVKEGERRSTIKQGEQQALEKAAEQASNAQTASASSIKETVAEAVRKISEGEGKINTSNEGGRRISTSNEGGRRVSTSNEGGRRMSASNSPGGGPRRVSASYEAGQIAAQATAQPRRNSMTSMLKDAQAVGRRRSSSGWVSAKEVRFAVLSMAEKQDDDKEKAMYNVFLRTIEVKQPVTVPVVEDVFRTAVAPFSLSPEEVHAIFKLSIMGKEQRVPIQDLILRAIGGLGYRYEKLRERLELPKQESKQETLRKRRESKFKLPEKGEYLDLGLNFAASETVIRQPVGNKKERMRGATFSGKKEKGEGNSLDHSSLIAGNKEAARTPQGRLHQRNMRLSLKKSRSVEALRSAGKHRGSDRDISKMTIAASSAQPRKLVRTASSPSLEGTEESFEVPSGAEGDGEDNDAKSDAAASSSSAKDKEAREENQSSDSSSSSSNMKRRKSIQHMERRKSLSVAVLGDTIDENESPAALKSFKPNVSDLSGMLDVSSAPQKASEGSTVDDVLGPRGRRASVLSKRVFGHFRKGGSEKSPTKDESKDKDKDQSKETFGLMETSPSASSSSSIQPRALMGNALRKLEFLSAAGLGGLSAAASDSKKERQGDALLSIGGTADSGEAWAFQQDEEPVSPLMGGVQERGTPLSADAQETRTTGSSSASSATTTEPTTPTSGPARDHQAEAVQVALREQAEREHHLQRLALFDGDSIELEIATRKLQELRGKLIAKYKSLPKAFDELAGSRSASIKLQVLQDRCVKLLKYNILDAERMAAIMATVEDTSGGINFSSFMNILWRFACPAHTLLQFRARLVQRHGTMDAAFRVMGVRMDEELSIDVFERPMLGAGVVSNDTRKLFRVLDAVQWKGPSGFLTLSTVRFVLDHAYVLAWLDVFNSRLGGRAGVRATFSKLPALQQFGGIEEPIESAAHLQSLLEPVGFPSECVPALFDFLAHRTPHKVTIAGLLHIMHHAFEEHRKDAASSHHADTGVTVGPSEATRDRALTLTMQLRRRIMQQFANYQVAYDAFHAKRHDDGLTLDEWEEALETFWSDDAHSWALIFGHICNFQHVRWDPKHKGAEARVNLSRLAAALNGVAPCQSLSAFRHRMQSQEQTHSPAQAWTLFTGKDNVEEIHLTQWQHALLRHLNIPHEDAGRLFAMLRAIPCHQHTHQHLLLSRSNFMAGIRSQAAVDHNTLFQNLLSRLSTEFGNISRAFEGYYPSEPLQLEKFEENVGMLLGCSQTDCRTMFLMLDSTRDGLVAVDQLINSLTEMQEVYLPFAAVNLKDAEQDAREHARSSLGHMRGSLISHLSRSHQKKHHGHQEASRASRASPSPVPKALSPEQDEDLNPSVLSRLHKKYPGDEGEDAKETSSPGGLKTGSTTIPDDESAVDSSADSSGEAAPRPQTVPAESNRDAGHPPDQRRLGPMPFLEGWEQRDSDRPSTSPQQGNTDAGISGGTRRKSVHMRGQVQPAARPPPLAMALRNLVHQRRADEDHNSLVYTSLNAPDAAQPREPTSPVPALMPSTSVPHVLAGSTARRPGAGAPASHRSSVKTGQSSASHRFSAAGHHAGHHSGSSASGHHAGVDSSALDVLGGDLPSPSSSRLAAVHDWPEADSHRATSSPRQKGVAKGSPLKMNMGNFLSGARSSQASSVHLSGSALGQQQAAGGGAAAAHRPPGNSMGVASAAVAAILSGRQRAGMAPT